VDRPCQTLLETRLAREPGYTQLCRLLRLKTQVDGWVWCSVWLCGVVKRIVLLCVVKLLIRIDDTYTHQTVPCVRGRRTRSRTH
jgi:hypothetical protein